MLIVDLARIYTLVAGVPVANTHYRLDISANAGEVSEQNARDLRDAPKSWALDDCPTLDAVTSKMLWG